MIMSLQKRLLQVGVTAAWCCCMATAQAAVIFSDTFDGTSNTVGNGWIETENGASDVARVNGVLQLRDELSGNPDARAARTTISTVGYTSIQLSYDWAPITASSGSDELHVEWSANGGATWTELSGSPHTLGGSGSFSQVLANLGAGASGVTNLGLRFWTDVNKSDEGAYIDNVRVSGTSVSIAAVPEPASLALIALGLAGLGIIRRKKA
jgi:PEP-CTERM motif